ncbi:MAG TPA: hypothetical protein VKR23_16040 [Gaiellaceae bacterium]|nr:hypothetical protein [Gaiellaceae bacterium]
MAWIRLSDDYNDHPKFDNLSDGAFRLWHQAMGFCRKFQTDGRVPTATVRKFKAYTAKRQRELMTPWHPGAEPLWHPVEGFGVRVHDYVEWNLSKDEEAKDRDAAVLRMRRLRKGKRDGARSGEQDAEHQGARAPDVPGTGTGQDPGSDSEKGSGEKLLPPPSARSRHPVFKGRRLVVFEFMLEDLMKMLGNYTDGFGLDEWFVELDELVGRTDVVIPPRDGGQWLLAQTLNEARRRGLVIAETDRFYNAVADDKVWDEIRKAGPG